MKLVCGLGNPGEKYVDNRHNVGRKVIENYRIANCKLSNYGLSNWESFNMAEICKCGDVVLARAGEEVYMNESGGWVKRVGDFFKVENKDVVVVYDDLDLEMGRVKVTDKGPKIHNGINSVVEAIGEGFVHVRCGVDDRNGDRSVLGMDYVLMDFEDLKKRDELVNSAVREVEGLIG